MRKKNILINTSNLHVGGGVAVASSFIDCLSEIDAPDLRIHLLLSTEVSANLRGLGVNLSVFEDVSILNVFGIKQLYSPLSSFFDGKDLVFTLFGPAYFVFKKVRHIVGFAQPNIIYPGERVYIRPGFGVRLFDHLKYGIQSLFFSRADALVVELQHVRNGLNRLFLFQSMPIHIVHSAVHSIYSDASRWGEFKLPEDSCDLSLGVVSRNYAHKNLVILPDIKQCLFEMFGLRVRFFVTFQSDEWSICSERFRSEIVNVGGLRLDQCPRFYSMLDGVIFPSLLECFSAVPIEAMMTRTPLFVSNLPFMVDVCDANAEYFDPHDPRGIAEVIAKYFELDVTERTRRLDVAYDHVQKFNKPVERAQSYLDLLRLYS